MAEGPIGRRGTENRGQEECGRGMRVRDMKMGAGVHVRKAGCRCGGMADVILVTALPEVFGVRIHGLWRMDGQERHDR